MRRIGDNSDIFQVRLDSIVNRQQRGLLTPLEALAEASKLRQDIDAWQRACPWWDRVAYWIYCKYHDLAFLARVQTPNWKP